VKYTNSCGRERKVFKLLGDLSPHEAPNRSNYRHKPVMFRLYKTIIEGRDDIY